MSIATATTTTQDKILNVIITAIDNGKKIYKHDGDNISISVSDEDYRYLRETSGTLDIDDLTERSNILNNALRREGIDTEIYCVGALVRGTTK